jgi:RimJ/RimL family protein N-acetyltransferase
MIETREYQTGDMAFVRQNPFQKEVKDYPDLIIPSNTYTCIFDGEIVAVGGINLFHEGMGESWIVMTKQSKKNGVFGLIACRAIENKLNELIDQLRMRRTEANVRKNFPIAIRFVEALGFKFDCERKNFFPGGISSMLYSKVNDEYI